MYTLAENAIQRIPVRYQKVTRQFIKFGITGMIGAVVDFGTYAIITRGFDWNHYYLVLGRRISVANNISVFLALISNFLINKYWTFRYLQGNVVGQGLSYFSFNLVTWTLNQFLVSYFAFELLIFESFFGHNKDIAAKVAAIGIVMFFNFLSSKLLIFRNA